MQHPLDTIPPNEGSSGSSGPGDELQPDSPPTSPDAPAPARKRRGFAVMDPKLVSEISRKGGKAAHTAGTAHEFTSDEARAAGRKGGLASHAKRRRNSGTSAKPSGE